MNLVLCSEHFLCRGPTGHSEEFIEKRAHGSRVGTAVSIQPRARPGPHARTDASQCEGSKEKLHKTVNDSQFRKKGIEEAELLFCLLRIPQHLSKPGVISWASSSTRTGD